MLIWLRELTTALACNLTGMRAAQIA